MMYYYGNWGGYPFFGGFMMIVFWIAIIAGVVWIVRSSTHHGKHGGCCGGHGMGGNSAIDILKERYAKGEIGKEEFDAKKKDLEG